MATAAAVAIEAPLALGSAVLARHPLDCSKSEMWTVRMTMARPFDCGALCLSLWDSIPSGYCHYDQAAMQQGAFAAAVICNCYGQLFGSCQGYCC